MYLDVLVETAGGVQHLAALSTLQGLPSGHYNLFNASPLCDSCVCQWTTDNKIGVGPVNLCVAGLVNTTHGHCSHPRSPCHRTSNICGEDYQRKSVLNSTSVVGGLVG